MAMTHTASYEAAVGLTRKCIKTQYAIRWCHQAQFGGLPVISVMRDTERRGGLGIATGSHEKAAKPAVVFQLFEGRHDLSVFRGASTRISPIPGSNHMAETMPTGGPPETSRTRVHR